MAAASATHHRDLRTGRSIWSARRRPAISSRPLTRDIACDAIVVGAGVSGALIAEALSEAGLTTVIVDRRGPAEGSTAASRSEEHTSELQSLMRISYAVFCLKKKKKHHNNQNGHT